ncbi:MAG: transketolase [Actinobacteria bacterium]|nr:transketolase [Actinomycetota bacterium]
MQADERRQLAQQLRVDTVRAPSVTGSGHPTSGMSAAELMAVLFDGYLRYDFARPDNPGNDHLIFSKGHATPLLYALYKAAGAIDDEELMTYRLRGSRLEGHPTPVLPWVDVGTGSLGQGLPFGVGIALTGKRLDRLPYRVWVLCGDSEMTEGSMWEAFERAAFEQLDNLTAIIDVNRLGQRGPTQYGWDTDVYRRRAEAFGWHAVEVDGHDVEAVDQAYADAIDTSGRPTVIIARTVKGKGVAAVENVDGRHGKGIDDVEAAIDELGGATNVSVAVAAPDGDGKPHTFQTGSADLPAWDIGEKVATRDAYGAALAALGSRRGDVVALDGEVSNSTRAEDFKDAHPERFFEMYIAEQQMIAAAVGMAVRGWTPFASTFSAFTSRAYDFVRMAAVSRASIRVSGSHAGVEIGQDGPSQMGLEDLAAYRAIHGSTVLYPADANTTAALVAAMADREGISYLRTTRGGTPVIHAADADITIGGSAVVTSSDDDAVTVCAAGITLHETLQAAETLANEGIAVRVIDCYSVKPLDAETVHAAVAATDGRVVTVEDHRPEGGLGDAVLDALATGDVCVQARKLAVRTMPGSATSDEQLADAEIDASAIADAVRDLVERSDR